MRIAQAADVNLEKGGRVASHNLLAVGDATSRHSADYRESLRRDRLGRGGFTVAQAHWRL